MRPVPMAARIAGSLVCAACCAIVLTGCAEQAQLPPPRRQYVRLMEVESRAVLRSREFVGRVVPVSTVDLSLQVGGLLETFPVVEGSVVPKGGLIAQLEQEDFERAVREAELRLDQERRNLDRNRTLLESRTIPQAAFEAIEAQVGLLEIALEVAERNVSHTRLEAPFDALITRRLVENFSNVEPGRPLVRVQDVGEMRIQFSIPEDLMPRASDARRYAMEALIPAHPELVFPLAYREHTTEPDQSTQTYRVTVAITETHDALVLPGMTAIVRIRERESALPGDAFPVPVSALTVASSGDFQVWVYDEASGKVQPLTVQTIPLDSQQVLVTGGLRGGEQIVTAGASQLSAGLTVRPWQGFE